MAFPTVVLAEKSIAVFPGWSVPEKGSGAVWFDAPLEIGGVVEPGLVLHGTALLYAPDCNVALELVARGTLTRKRIPLTRIDWRSLRGGHSNQRGRNCGEWSRVRVGHTHIHPFDMNWVVQEERMRGVNLPCAKPIDRALHTFEDVSAYSGKELRINNIDIVTRPKWDYDLFDERVDWNE
ncbi:MAG: hypothetical protein HQL41_12775 [Alphaproteobacteria bacterium]|nr:hypothetical protein [Alphaproteobacteria bacterium]